jgi:hypothetical protein
MGFHWCVTTIDLKRPLAFSSSRWHPVWRVSVAASSFGCFHDHPVVSLIHMTAATSIIAGGTL